MRTYSTREVTELLGIRSERVRSYARQGIVTSTRNAHGHYRFSFQDLVLLRTANELVEAKLGAHRVWRALRAVRSQLPDGRPLSSVRVFAEADRVIVRERNTAWEPESGQTILNFTVDEIAEKVAPLVKASASLAREQANTSEEWFDLALEFDQIDAKEDAQAAYREALFLDEYHINARINLGRLFHNKRDHQQAEELYREALKIDPANSIAAFNIGVVLEDQGATQEAMRAYHHTLSIDPTLPDVHYNLARLYEYQGDKQAALRHFSRFKALNGQRNDNN